MITDYMIVSEYSHSLVETRVKELLRSSWEPFGSLAVVAIPMGGGGCNIQYVQPMVKQTKPLW